MKKYLIIFILFLAIFSSERVNVAHAQFYSDLGLGSRGQDVADLQTWLINHGFPIPSVTAGFTPPGYFGVQTQQALVAYQSSAGLVATGYLDASTRSRMSGGNSYQQYPSYGYNSQPVINGVDAPTTLNVNQSGTWTVRATDSNGGYYGSNLTYSVDWGDTYNLYTPSYAQPYSQIYSQSATFTHSYANTGIYTVRFTVRNASGETAQTSATVQVTSYYGNGGNGGAGPLRIISPNGGESLQKGTNQYVTWSAPYYFTATTATLKLIPYNYSYSTTPYIISTNVSINQNSYLWRVGDYWTGQVPDGQYSIQICDVAGTMCDTSDSSFSIYSGYSYPTYPQNPPNCPYGFICRPIGY